VYKSKKDLERNNYNKIKRRNSQRQRERERTWGAAALLTLLGNATRKRISIINDGIMKWINSLGKSVCVCVCVCVCCVEEKCRKKN
jgi:hypothetical protein